MLVSLAISVLVYFSSMLIFKSVISVAYIDTAFFVRIMVVTVSSWLPLHLIKRVKTIYYPNDYEKIMQIDRQKKRSLVTQI